MPRPRPGSPSGIVRPLPGRGVNLNQLDVSGTYTQGAALEIQLDGIAGTAGQPNVAGAANPSLALPGVEPAESGTAALC